MFVVQAMLNELTGEWLCLSLVSLFNHFFILTADVVAFNANALWIEVAIMRHYFVLFLYLNSRKSGGGDSIFIIQNCIAHKHVRVREGQVWKWDASRLDAQA